MRSKSAEQTVMTVSGTQSRRLARDGLVPGAAQKTSRHQVRGGDLAGLLGRLAALQRKAHARTGQLARIVVIG